MRRELPPGSEREGTKGGEGGRRKRGRSHGNRNPLRDNYLTAQNHKEGGESRSVAMAVAATLGADCAARGACRPELGIVDKVNKAVRSSSRQAPRRMGQLC